MFSTFLAVTDKDISKVVSPLLEVLRVLVPVLLGVVGAIGAIWVIFLGVKYARAEDPQEHDKAKASLKNAIIGFVLIFVLLISLQIAVSVFTNWYESYDYQVL